MRTSGSSCSASAELRDGRTTVSGTVAIDGNLTATRARRLARAILEGASGRPVRGRIRCLSSARARMTCTVAGLRDRRARLDFFHQTGSGGFSRWSWRGAMERP